MGHRILPFIRRLRTSRTLRSSFTATCGTSAPQVRGRDGAPHLGVQSLGAALQPRRGRGRYVAFDYGFLWEAVSFFAIGIKGLVFNK